MTPRGFRQCCRRHFAYLIGEYGFRLEPPLEGEFVQPYQARFASDAVRLVVTGTSWGTNVEVTLTRLDTGDVYFTRHLLRERDRAFKSLPSETESEDIQQRMIKHEAAAIKEHLGDVLSGTFKKIAKSKKYPAARDYG